MRKVLRKLGIGKRTEKRYDNEFGIPLLYLNGTMEEYKQRLSDWKFTPGMNGKAGYCSITKEYECNNNGRFLVALGNNTAVVFREPKGSVLDNSQIAERSLLSNKIHTEPLVLYNREHDCFIWSEHLHIDNAILFDVTQALSELVKGNQNTLN